MHGGHVRDNEDVCAGSCGDGDSAVALGDERGDDSDAMAQNGKPRSLCLGYYTERNIARYRWASQMSDSR